MKHRIFHAKPAAKVDFIPEDFYIQISDHWEQRARQLRAKRLRMLKQQTHKDVKEPYFVMK